MTLLDIEEETRRLTALALPAVEDVLRLMAAEGVEDLAENFRALLGLDMTAPPSLPLARYLVHVRLLRATFRYGGNDLAVEVALGRAADLVVALL